MALDPRQLRAFLAVVETGSLGRAAEKLHLSEPGVSRIIKRLESQLQAPLFERRTTGMELTSFGEALLPYANLLAAEAAHAISEIDALRGMERGVLRIGAVASAAIMVLPEAVDRLLRRAPAARIEITEAVEDKLAAGLAANLLDIALCGAITEDPEVLRVAELAFGDGYRVIAAPTHPLHDRAQVTLRDLEDARWVMPPLGTEPRRLFEATVSGLGGAPPTVPVETRSPTVIKSTVARTDFLGWLPEPLFAAEAAAGLVRVLPVEGLGVPRRFHVYRRNRGLACPLLVKFLEELRALKLPGAPVGRPPIWGPPAGRA